MTDSALVLSESLNAEARASLFFESHMSLELNLQSQTRPCQVLQDSKPLLVYKESRIHAGQVFVDDDDDDDDDAGGGGGDDDDDDAGGGGDDDDDVDVDVDVDVDGGYHSSSCSLASCFF